MANIEDIAFQPAAYHSPRQLQHVLTRAADHNATYSPEVLFELIEQLAIHGLVNEFDEFATSREQQLARSKALMRHAFHYRNFLSDCEKLIGKDFSAKLEFDLLNEVPQLVARGEKSERLLIVVPTFYNNAMLSMPLLNAILDPLKIDTLFLKATHATLPYYDGFYGFGHTRDKSAEVIGAFCASRGYTEVNIIGASSGGFLALWLGAALGARRVCVYGSDIRPTMQSKHLSRPHIARSVGEKEIGELSDLSRIGTIHAFAGNMRSRDVECLTYLERYPNVTTELEIGVGHLVLLKLISKGYDFPEFQVAKSHH